MKIQVIIHEAEAGSFRLIYHKLYSIKLRK